MPDVAHFAGFVPVLKTQELPQRLWKLCGVLRFYSLVVSEWVEAPDGFITDGCSVPCLPGVYLLAGGKAEEAGYIHDWLYTSQKYPRATADLVLREAVMVMGYDRALADAMYAAVRAFGGSHWVLPNQPQGKVVQDILDGLLA